jgi:hypothetical protein
MMMTTMPRTKTTNRTTKAPSELSGQSPRYGTEEITMPESAEFDDDDFDNIHDFIVRSDFVDGPAELYAIVSELWPELLHKVKPPRYLMH